MSRARREEAAASDCGEGLKENRAGEKGGLRWGGQRRGRDVGASPVDSWGRNTLGRGNSRGKGPDMRKVIQPGAAGLERERLTVGEEATWSTRGHHMVPAFVGDRDLPTVEAGKAERTDGYRGW